MQKYTLNGLKLAYDMWMGQDNFLFFWKPDEVPGKITEACLCQWYPCKFTIDGIEYNCAEQYMMAEKARLFGDEEICEKIQKETDPSIIKHLGREVKNFDSKKWDSVSFNVVLNGNAAKFSQNPKLRDFLLSTGSKVLAEASPYDKIWGIGMNKAEAVKAYPHIWRGKNLLGFALMEVRDNIRDAKYESYSYNYRINID